MEIMKKINLVAFISAVIFLIACNGSTNSPGMYSDSTSSMTKADSNLVAASSSDVSNDIKDFSKEAAQGGMMEVKLGKIAMKNGKSQAVKDFGKMMVDDHTKINDQLKKLASNKNIDLPATVSDAQQKEIDKLSNESGSAFDKDYVKMMTKDHKEDIEAFKKEGDRASDSDYKSFISKTLPTLQKHLDAIEAIKM